jgi:hypothetical protein
MKRVILSTYYLVKAKETSIFALCYYLQFIQNHIIEHYETYFSPSPTSFLL